MRKLILATASVLALGLAGAGPGFAQTSSTGTTSQGTGMQGTQGETGATNLSKSQIEHVQRQLKSAGLYNGDADGEMNSETKTAVSEFQKKHNLPQTGTIDEQTLSELNSSTTGSGSSTSHSGMPAPTK